MKAGRFARVAQFSLLALALVSLFAVSQAYATHMLQDRGIYLAGPFPVPDITKAPGESAEAVFLAGSAAKAPLFLNELLVGGSIGQFSNNGWVTGSYFDVSVENGGRAAEISWNLSGTPYALTYFSVNFDNDFYHVYYTSPLSQSQGSVEITGNVRDVISRIHLFGISRVPEPGSTSAMFIISLASLVFFRRGIRRRL